MKITAVICEFNPFHNGHAYLLDSIKNSCDDALICIMSGDVMQRGFLPILDKYTRAKHAVIANADMVIELSPEYACSPAEVFALGGVATAIAAGADRLAFGSESGEINSLINAAKITDENNVVVNTEIRNNLKKGLSHPSARKKALITCGYSDIAEILDKPNNLLAVEYIRAVLKLKPEMELFTVKRSGCNHDENKISDKITSSSTIRKHICNNLEIPKQCMPEYVYKDLIYDIESDDKLLSIIKYIICNQEIGNICGMAEGLDKKIKKTILSCNSLSDAVNYIKSKRYTEARIRRLLTNIAIGNTCAYPSLNKAEIKHLNILAMRARARQLISKFNVPAIVRPYDKVRLGIEDSLAQRASSLFRSCMYNYENKTFIYN